MPNYQLALLIGKGLLMRTVRRASVASAATLLAVIVTLIFFSYSSTEDTGWSRFSSVTLVSLFMVGAGAAWVSLGEGKEPSLLAPLMSSVWLFMVTVAVLLQLSGATLTMRKVYYAPVPEPAATIYLLVSVACAVYVVAMGFWLLKRDS